MDNVYILLLAPRPRWRGASDKHTGQYVRSEQQSQRACGPQPEGAPGARAKMQTLFIDRP